jgi:hypothetical protein
MIAGVATRCCGSTGTAVRVIVTVTSGTAAADVELKNLG